MSYELYDLSGIGPQKDHEIIEREAWQWAIDNGYLPVVGDVCYSCGNLIISGFTPVPITWKKGCRLVVTKVDEEKHLIHLHGETFRGEGDWSEYISGFLGCFWIEGRHYLDDDLPEGEIYDLGW